MKKIFVLCLLLGFVFLLNPSNAAETDNNKHSGYISLNASRTKEVEPNVASVSFAVENTANDAKSAVEKNNEVSNAIINALKQVTDPEVDVIKTNNFSVRPVYSSNGGKRVIKNYMTVNSVTVQTKDTKKVASFIDIAIKSGANRTEGLSYSYENDNSVCQEIYPELLKELKLQAESIAKAAGTTVDGIKQIGASCNTSMAFSSNGRFYAAKYTDGASSAVEEAAVSTPVESGKVKINVYVNADFYVK